MKTILILIDSLNRRCLSAYGAEDGMRAFTPNIDRLAERSLIFDNHFCGSSPCMPARRDILTGRLNFMERPWGGIEPFDHTLTSILKSEKNVFSHMETDHFHYSERGGENYWGHFTSWKLHRGTEWDTIYSGPDKNGIPGSNPPDGFTGVYASSYETTRALYADRPENYSSPRTLLGAADWLERYHDADNFLLWAEPFDPHEPFDVPKQYLERYMAPAEIREDCYWPDYTTADHYTEEEILQFRKRYLALLTMTDDYLGRLLDVMDRYDMWRDTTVILTTDHGYMLGEHGFMAKNYMPDYNELYHIPLMIAAPSVPAGRTDALTQNIDLFPTVLESYGIDAAKVCRNPIHGKSLWPLLTAAADRKDTYALRETVIYGMFGKAVNIYDGRYTYHRDRKDGTNEPLHIYGAMMVMLNDYIGLDTMSDEEIRRIETGRFLSWTDYPVYKVNAKDCHWKNASQQFDVPLKYTGGTRLFDLKNDYRQQQPVESPEIEEEMIRKLVRAMAEHDAPAEQYERLGLPAADRQ